MTAVIPDQFLVKVHVTVCSLALAESKEPIGLSWISFPLWEASVELQLILNIHWSGVWNGICWFSEWGGEDCNVGV